MDHSQCHLYPHPQKHQGQKCQNASEDDVPPVPLLLSPIPTTPLCEHLAEHMAHCTERTDRPWRSAGHGAPPLGVVCRCPTEMLPER